MQFPTPTAPHPPTLGPSVERATVARRGAGRALAAHPLKGQGIVVPATAVDARRETDQHVLLWQAHGRSVVTVDDTSVALRAGTALWVPVGVEHGLVTAENSAVLPLFFPTESVVSALDEPTVFAVDGSLEVLLLVAVQTTYSIIGEDIELDQQIVDVLEGRRDRTEGLPLPTAEAARQVAETLLRRPGDDRSLEALAASVHVSSRTIERAFRTETGMTLRAWRIRNRMMAAAHKLRSDLPIDRVARDVGYLDTNAFRRVFKSHYGVTPSAYATGHPGSRR